MSNVLKEYNKMCKKEFDSYNFKLFHNNHYRVINDIFQSFRLHRSISGQECTVEFGIIPMSVGYDLNKSSVCPYHLNNFTGMHDWFEYDRNSPEDVNACVVKLIADMKKYLMPLFDKAVDSKSAYELMCEHNDIFAGNSYERFCMCLKIEDYEDAKTYINKVIAQSTHAFERNREAFGDNIAHTYIEKMEEKISEEENLLKMTLSKNYELIQKWLITNEKRNMQNLGF